MWRTRGHAEAVALLQGSLADGRMSHAYLFTGAAHTGKATLAVELAMALNCTTWQGEAKPSLFAEEAAPSGPPAPCYECASCRKVLAGAHPDVSVVEHWTAEKLSIVDQVRTIQYASALHPFEGRWKVYVLLNAEELTLAAQNALLKTLEEPAATVCLILTAPSARALLPTVVSRCQQVQLRTPSREAIAQALVDLRDMAPEKAEELAGLAGGNIGWALDAAQNQALLEGRSAALDQLAEVLGASVQRRFKIAEELAAAATGDPEEVDERLQLWLGWLRDALLVAEGLETRIVHEDRQAEIRAAAAALGARPLAAAVQVLQRTRNHLAGSTNTRLALEVLMLKLPELGKPAAAGSR